MVDKQVRNFRQMFQGGLTSLAHKISMMDVLNIDRPEEEQEELGLTCMGLVPSDLAVVITMCLDVLDRPSNLLSLTEEDERNWQDCIVACLPEDISCSEVLAALKGTGENDDSGAEGACV